MECDEFPAEAASAGFSPVTPKTGEHRDFVAGVDVAGVSGVFTCANLGRFSADYGTFSHEVQCEYRPGEQKAVMMGSPDAWGPCKTSKLQVNLFLGGLNQDLTFSLSRFLSRDSNCPARNAIAPRLQRE